MNPTSISGIQGSARAVVRDQLSLEEARLWDRARVNLVLLYGGRRACRGHGQASGTKSGTSPFGNAGSGL
jgi:hypothetical protein